MLRKSGGIRRSREIGRLRGKWAEELSSGLRYQLNFKKNSSEERRKEMMDSGALVSVDRKEIASGGRVRVRGKMFAGPRIWIWKQVAVRIGQSLIDDIWQDRWTTS